jgi:hypothetical protein
VRERYQSLIEKSEEEDDEVNPAVFGRAGGAAAGSGNEDGDGPFDTKDHPCLVRRRSPRSNRYES